MIIPNGVPLTMSTTFSIISRHQSSLLDKYLI